MINLTSIFFLSFKRFKIDSAIVPAAQEISFLALTGLENHYFSLLWRGSSSAL